MLFMLLCCSLELNFDRVGIRKNWEKITQEIILKVSSVSTFVYILENLIASVTVKPRLF